ncbi:uncharacterized protein [Triticum aestivum]|uniref:uncharacterized protein isoform X1 n=2 Tax=Triticum aestivum TaxID=4565 RepID=UPI001D00DFAA|nr:uncharacterized protein LOC123088064 isoform X1 [Triticum aestivum]
MSSPRLREVAVARVAAQTGRHACPGAVTAADARSQAPLALPLRSIPVAQMAAHPRSTSPPPSVQYACYDQPSSSRRRHLPPPTSNVRPSSRSLSEQMDPTEILAAVQELEEEGDYDGNDYGEDNETSSLNMDEPAEENYMSLDESYSGNRHGDDDDDMDIDDSFDESALRMDEDGDFVRNIVDDESDKSHIDASHDDSSSKGDVDGTSGMLTPKAHQNRMLKAAVRMVLMSLKMGDLKLLMRKANVNVDSAVFRVIISPRALKILRTLFELWSMEDCFTL